MVGILQSVHRETWEAEVFMKFMGGQAVACTAGRDCSEPCCSGVPCNALQALSSTRYGLLPLLHPAKAQRQLLSQHAHYLSELLCADAGTQTAATGECCASVHTKPSVQLSKFEAGGASRAGMAACANAGNKLEMLILKVLVLELEFQPADSWLWWLVTLTAQGVRAFLAQELIPEEA